MVELKRVPLSELALEVVIVERITQLSGYLDVAGATEGVTEHPSHLWR